MNTFVEHINRSLFFIVFLNFNSLLMAVNHYEASQIIFLSIVANYSLFPLLFTSELLIIKLSLYLFYTATIWYAVRVIQSNKENRILSWHEVIYALGLIGIFSYEVCFQYVLGLDQKLPFLPLLLTSVYCSIGITYFWLKYYIRFVFTSQQPAEMKTVPNTNLKRKKKKN